MDDSQKPQEENQEIPQEELDIMGRGDIEEQPEEADEESK